MGRIRAGAHKHRACCEPRLAIVCVSTVWPQGTGSSCGMPRHVAPAPLALTARWPWLRRQCTSASVLRPHVLHATPRLPEDLARPRTAFDDVGAVLIWVGSVRPRPAGRASHLRVPPAAHSALGGTLSSRCCFAHQRLVCRKRSQAPSLLCTHRAGHSLPTRPSYRFFLLLFSSVHL